MRWNGESPFKFDWKSVETEATAWSEFPSGGKAIVEQTLAWEEINESKRAGLWESQSGIQIGKLTIWVSSFEMIKSIGPTIKYYPVLIIGHSIFIIGSNRMG